MADGPINLAVLKGDFSRAEFLVKVANRGEDGIFTFEWNYPDDRRGIAMRTAMAKNGAEVSTYYQYQSKSDNRGDLMSRDRALIPFNSDADIRKFFNATMDDYMGFLDEGLGPRGNKESSYHAKERKTVRPLGA